MKIHFDREVARRRGAAFDSPSSSGLFAGIAKT
jgi:hypothetical protein